MSIKQVKKAISVFLALAILFAGVPVMGTLAQAADETYTDTTGVYQCKTINGLLTITAVLDKSKISSNYTVPSTLTFNTGLNGERDIDGIGDNAFNGCTQLVNLTVPSTVQAVGYNAFSNCSGLTKVDWQAVITSKKDGETYVGNYYAYNEQSPFYGCANLTNFVYNSTAPDIPVGLCSRVYALKTVEFKTKPATIGTYAFYCCTGLTQIDLTHIVTVKNQAFSGCTKLESIDLKKVETIGNEAFSGTLCTVSDYTLTVPSTVQVVGYNAFSNCSGLTKVDWQAVITSKQNGETYVGNYYAYNEQSPFYGCANLTNFVYNSTAPDIPVGLCSRVYALKTVEFKTKPATIGTYAFYCCTGLTQIDLTHIVTVNNRAFSGCTKLESIDLKQVETIGNEAFSGTLGSVSNYTLTVPSTVHAVGLKAFSNCNGLKTVDWQANITTINDSFSNDEKEVFVGTYYNYNSPFIDCINLTDFIYDSTDTVVPHNLCANMSSLNTLIFKGKPTVINTYAFYGCTHLKDVYYPGSEAEWNNITIKKCNDSLISDTAVKHFNAVLYLITYNANGGIHAPDSQYKCKGVTLTLSSAKPTRGGYTFKGWAETSNAQAAAYQPGASFTKDANTTLYAVWEGISDTLQCIGVPIKPTKTTYFVGEAFSEAGLRVTATYSVSGTRDITGYTLSTPDMSTPGVKTVTVTYEGKTATFTITVQEQPDVLQSIAVSALPTKTTYTVGEAFNKAGLKVTAAYSVSGTQEITGYTLSAPDMSTPGIKTVTVSYEGKTATFTITVNPAPTQPRVIKVELSNVSINYKASAALKPTITADDGAEYTVKYESSNPDTVSVNEKTGEIYGAKKGTATIKVTVTDNTGKTVTATCKVTVKYAVWQWLIIYVLFGWIWYK